MGNSNGNLHKESSKEEMFRLRYWLENHGLRDIKDVKTAAKEGMQEGLKNSLNKLRLVWLFIRSTRLYLNSMGTLKYLPKAAIR